MLTCERCGYEGRDLDVREGPEGVRCASCATGSPALVRAQQKALQAHADSAWALGGASGRSTVHKAIRALRKRDRACGRWAFLLRREGIPVRAFPAHRFGDPRMTWPRAIAVTCGR